jgi:penicillin amidase
MPAARAAQIRGDLRSLVQIQAAKVTPADLLSIALDDRALFLARWRGLLLETLSPAAVAAKKSRAELRAAAENWDGRADIGSVGYRLVRMFRREVANRTLAPIFAACTDADPEFDWTRFCYEDAVWTLVHSRPLHLLSPAYAGWDELLRASADDIGAALRESGISPATATWGRRNTLRMQHPFARIFPAWLSRWLSMPAEPLPGDSDMPRVQSPSFGASERFVVSPGHEAEGIFEMPGGQSGHPLSPFFRAGHQAWVRGEPSHFLPGPTAHRLILEPAAEGGPKL